MIPIPSKVGEYLPSLKPLFSCLSAVGALAGGAAGIVKVVGSVLYLKPYEYSMGLYLKPLYRRRWIANKKKSSS